MKDIRTCIACRNRCEKKTLNRIVVDDLGHTIIDKSHTYNSRGVYVCNKKECIEKLKKIKDINKVVKIKTTKEEFLKVISELGENIH